MSNLYIEARLQAIKDIASASCSDIKDADNIASFCDEIYSAIPKLDKIIEELELHSFELGTDTIPVHYVRLNDAIEIVKQGSDANDVCEWEKGSSGYIGYPAYYSKCCTTNSKGLEMQTHIIADWKYCPYCGKKIKIVGD